MVRRIRKIKEIVNELLEDPLSICPWIDVERLAKKQNIQIRKEDLKGVSGFIYKDGDQVIIGVNENDVLSRQRFTIAHELGHYFLHTQTPLHVDKEVPIKLRDHVSSEAINLEEIEANAFAAELLMPTKMIYEDYRQLLLTIETDEDEVLDQIIGVLSKKYKVSKQAITIRLSSLGYFQGSL